MLLGGEHGGEGEHGVGGEHGGDREAWTSPWDLQIYTVIYRMDKQARSYYITQVIVQYPVINQNREEYEEECISIYNWVMLLYSRN